MKSLFLLFLFAFLITYADSKKCRALALAGGGSKGAYEAAVFKGMVESLPLEEVSYDVLTGVSAGALNSLGLSVYKPEEAVEAAEYITNLWSLIPENKAYQDWPYGILQGVFFERAIYDISPGYEWVKEQVGNRTIQRKVTLTTADANSATYVPWDYNATHTLPPDIIESAFASSTIPFIFPHVVRGDMALLDGGVIWDQDVNSAVRRWKEVVDDEKDIIVDMIIPHSHYRVHRPVEDLSYYSAFQHFLRGLDINRFWYVHDNINATMNLFPDVFFRYLITPSSSITVAPFPIEFSHRQVDVCFRVGEKDGKNAAKFGQHGNVKVAMEYLRRAEKGEDVNLDDMIEEALEQIQESHNNLNSQ